MLNGTINDELVTAQKSRSCPVSEEDDDTLEEIRKPSQLMRNRSLRGGSTLLVNRVSLSSSASV
jgi:hypothetical protein